VRPKVDQRADQLSLPHIGIIKAESNRTKTYKKLANKSFPYLCSSVGREN